MALFDTEDNQELINAYLYGNLTDVEKKAFETRLEESPALQQEYALHLAIVDGIKSLKREELLTKFNQWDEELPSINIKPKDSYLFYKLAASIMLLLIAGLFFFRNSKQPSLAAHEYIEEPGLPVLMSSSSDPWAASMNAYREKDYLGALKQLPRITKSNQDSVTYFKGVFLLKLNKQNEAVSELSDTILLTSPLQDKAAYYRAYALWQSGKDQKARQDFEIIAQDPQNPFQAEALEVLKKGLE